MDSRDLAKLRAKNKKIQQQRQQQVQAPQQQKQQQQQQENQREKEEVQQDQSATGKQNEERKQNTKANQIQRDPFSNLPVEWQEDIAARAEKLLLLSEQQQNQKQKQQNQNHNTSATGSVEVSSTTKGASSSKAAVNQMLRAPRPTALKTNSFSLDILEQYQLLKQHQQNKTGIIAFDTETTGFNIVKDQILEIAAVRHNLTTTKQEQEQEKQQDDGNNTISSCSNSDQNFDSNYQTTSFIAKCKLETNKKVNIHAAKVNGFTNKYLQEVHLKDPSIMTTSEAIIRFAEFVFEKPPSSKNKHEEQEQQHEEEQHEEEQEEEESYPLIVAHNSTFDVRFVLSQVKKILLHFELMKEKENTTTTTTTTNDNNKFSNSNNNNNNDNNANNSAVDRTNCLLSDVERVKNLLEKLENCLLNSSTVMCSMKFFAKVFPIQPKKLDLAFAFMTGNPMARIESRNNNNKIVNNNMLSNNNVRQREEEQQQQNTNNNTNNNNNNNQSELKTESQEQKETVFDDYGDEQIGIHDALTDAKACAVMTYEVMNYIYKCVHC